MNGDQPIDIKKLPPLGPTGPRNSRRAQMYRHNRKVAERRIKLIAEARLREQEKNGLED